jgi:thiol-disulfide isomerase/thioredoxin
MKHWIWTWGIAALLTASLGCGGDKPAEGPKTDSTTVVNPPPRPRGEPTKVEFEIKGYPGGMARFIGVIGATNYAIDSVVPGADGRIVLQQDTALPGGLYFLSLPPLAGAGQPGQMLQFLLDSDQTFSLKTEWTNLIGSAKVEGSPDNVLLYDNLRWEAQFQQEFQPLSASLNAAPVGTPLRDSLEKAQKALVDKRIAYIQAFKTSDPNAFFTAYKLAGQNPSLKEPRRADGSLDQETQVYLYRKDYWDNTPLNDERLLHTPIVANKLNTFILQLTPQIHDSLVKYGDLLIERAKVNQQMFKFIVNWIAIQYNEPKTMGLESIFVHVVDKYFTDALAFWSNPQELADIRKRVDDMRVSMIGMTGQDIRCKNTSGAYESIYGLNAAWTVVWIWNYECEHCQERTPMMKKVAAQYKSKGLEVFSLCTGMEEKPWKEFLQKYGTQTAFHNVWDPQYESNYYKKYHVDNTPELYLLDKNHKIVAKDLTPDQLPEQLNRLMAGK